MADSAAAAPEAVTTAGDEVLYEGAAARSTPGWLLGGRGARTIDVPQAETERLASTIARASSDSSCT